MAKQDTKQSKSGFHAFANSCSTAMGSRWAFIGAISIVLIWALTGPLSHYSDAWQLVINTGTTIVTFLMVFLIQNTQNRDARAIHLKLDELICAIGPAKNAMVDVEHLSDEELNAIAVKYERIQKAADKMTDNLDITNGNNQSKT